MMDVETLQKTLKKTQEPLGYFFNSNQEQVEALLSGLITNKNRYGYMSCPCRLASGSREKDKDIICPCIYRKPDVAEYGSCYCGFYVSAAWNEEKILRRPVPERRPPAARR